MTEFYFSPNRVLSPRSTQVCVPTTAVHTAVRVSLEFIDGNYVPARGVKSQADSVLAHCRKSAESGERKVYPLQAAQAERAAYALMKLEYATSVLRNFLERGISDPEAFVAISNMIVAAGQTVGKGTNGYGIAAIQHRNEQLWASGRYPEDNLILVDDPTIYDGACRPIVQRVGDCEGKKLTDHYKAERSSKRRLTKREADEEFKSKLRGED